MAAQNITLPSCSIAESIITDRRFQIAVTFECVLGVYAFVANVFLLVVGWRVMVFPINLRLLLGHLSFLLAWYALGGLVKGVYFFATPICDHVITSRSCRILDIMTTNWVLVIILLAVIAVCVERIFATVRYRRYEQEGKIDKPYISIGTILIIWTAASAYVWRTFPNIPKDLYTPLCDSLIFSKPEQIRPYYSVSMALETLCLLATMAVYFCNRTLLKNMVINRAIYDLSARFQVDQNVQVNTLLLPSMILHWVCFLANSIFMLSAGEMDLPTKGTFMHASFVWRQIYAGAHPTLAFALNPRMKQELLKNVIGRFFRSIGCRSGKIDGIADVLTRSKLEEEAHFRHLEQLWSLTRIPADHGRAVGRNAAHRRTSEKETTV